MFFESEVTVLLLKIHICMNVKLELRCWYGNSLQYYFLQHILKFYQLLGSVLKIFVAVRVWKINSFKLVVTIWQPNTNSMCVEMGEGAILGGKAISIMLGRFSEMEKEKLIFILNNWKTVSLTVAPECSQSIFRMFRALV